MAVQGSLSQQKSRRVPWKMNSGARNRTTSLFWIYSWIAASVIPLIPYAAPLWTATLDDTPYAYLIWIPVFAFTWAGWTLRRALSYNDDAELNAIVGVPVMALAGILLVAGLQPNWQYEFVTQSAGLLIWPFWALGLAWLLFGVGVTRYLARPLVYLWLSWPPLYSSIVSYTNPVLENLANRVIIAMAHALPWLHTGASVGAYNVDYGLHRAITVYVTSVCSGADSLLAVVILFPVIMVSFLGPAWKKLICVALAAILAILGNVARLLIIIGSIHGLGPNFSLGILHPVLGIILFILMMMVIIRFAQRIGLTHRKFQRSAFLRKPGGARFSLSLLSFGVLTALLWPLYQGAPGTESSPVPVSTSNLARLMPPIFGWQRSLIGNYDEASVLGPGATSTAMSYRTLFGDQIMAELWWTYQPLALQGYPENNCLMFHGSQIIAASVITIAKGIQATAYSVLLPPLTLGGPRALYVDTVYSFTTKYRGRTAYLRSEVATPVQMNVRSGNPLIANMPGVMKTLLNPGTPARLAVAPLSENQSVYLHNYFTFVHQYTDTLLNERGIYHLPAGQPGLVVKIRKA